MKQPDARVLFEGIADRGWARPMSTSFPSTSHSEDACCDAWATIACKGSSRSCHSRQRERGQFTYLQRALHRGRL